VEKFNGAKNAGRMADYRVMLRTYCNVFNLKPTITNLCCKQQNTAVLHFDNKF